ncbi:hypothetical protein Tsubulata_028615 [Turnera subulata]|uniref:Uncharacterized protein n=1 Tax=Turnera subulata TaxID=218843 RepID=A0A9Q0FMP4_9ROSI|nr:hypothetical protein Tsubulata_028615 [Turnera subulata]
MVELRELAEEPPEPEESALQSREIEFAQLVARREARSGRPFYFLRDDPDLCVWTVCELRKLNLRPDRETIDDLSVKIEENFDNTWFKARGLLYSVMGIWREASHDFESALLSPHSQDEVGPLNRLLDLTKANIIKEWEEEWAAAKAMSKPKLLSHAEEFQSKMMAGLALGPVASIEEVELWAGQGFKRIELPGVFNHHMEVWVNFKFVGVVRYEFRREAFFEDEVAENRRVFGSGPAWDRQFTVSFAVTKDAFRGSAGGGGHAIYNLIQMQEQFKDHIKLLVNLKCISVVDLQGGLLEARGYAPSDPATAVALELVFGEPCVINFRNPLLK